MSTDGLNGTGTERTNEPAHTDTIDSTAERIPIDPREREKAELLSMADAIAKKLEDVLSSALIEAFTPIALKSVSVLTDTHITLSIAAVRGNVWGRAFAATAPIMIARADVTESGAFAAALDASRRSADYALAAFDAKMAVSSAAPGGGSAGGVTVPSTAPQVGGGNGGQGRTL